MPNQFWEQLPPVDEFDALMKREYELLEKRMWGKGVSKELRHVRRAFRRHLDEGTVHDDTEKQVE